MTTLRIGVLYGGPSKEHEISVKTGRAMIEGLDPKAYQAVPIFLSKQGTWQIKDQELSQAEALNRLKEEIDVCMIGLHGTFGEDGQVQSLFEAAGIVFTGSGSEASKLAMQKHLASKKFKDIGLNVPSEITVTEWQDSLVDSLENSFTYPVVIKPEAQGSSVGVAIIEDGAAAKEAVLAALAEDSTVLIQEYVKGREVSCGVLETENGLLALSPTEVFPLTSGFYDYSAKYDVGATKEVTPPENMDAAMINQVKELAIKAHKLLGCSGYSRTDMIIEGDVIYVIETNTLPGMTVTSFLPQQVSAIGMPFSELLDSIIKAAVRKQEKHG